MSRNQNQRMLEGEVVESSNGPGDGGEINRLRELNRNLTRELHDTLEENEHLRKRVATADAPIARLREKLKPFYALLQSVFGDIDELDPEDAGSAAAANPSANTSAVWDSWKQKLGNSAARIITALQQHKELNTTQLVIVAKMDRRTVNNTIYKMNQAGLIDKNGGKFSLKQL